MLWWLTVGALPALLSLTAASRGQWVTAAAFALLALTCLGCAVLWRPPYRQARHATDWSGE